MTLIDTQLHYLPLNRANRYELTPLIDTRWHNVTLIDTHIRYHAYVRVVGTSCNSWAQHAFCSEVRRPHHFVARSNWMGRLWYFVTTEILSVRNPVVPGPFLVSAFVVYCLPCFFGIDNWLPWAAFFVGTLHLLFFGCFLLIIAHN